MSRDGLDVVESLRGESLAYSASVLRPHGEYWARNHDMYRRALAVLRLMGELIERIEDRSVGGDD